MIDGEAALALSCRDLSLERERERSEALLRKQRDQAVRLERLRSLGEMASGMAHEFFQPLSIIRSTAETLLIGCQRNWKIDIEELEQSYGQIISQVDRTSDLIEHLRRFTRQADSKERLPVELGTIVSSALRMCTARLTKAEATIPDRP